MGAGGYWNGPQSRLHFHISANEGAWGTTDARLFAHAAMRQPTLQPTAGVRPRGHAPAHRGRAATRPRSLLLDFYLSPLRET